MKTSLLVLALMASVFAEGGENRTCYINFCRDLALGTADENADPDDFMSKPDWMVYPSSIAYQEYKSEYKVVYADKAYLSFHCLDYSYTGGAHGGTCITVGTIDRKTGKVLTLADVPAFADRAALQKKLYNAVVAKIGKDALQAPVKPHNNFYRAADGWHFVYNEYDIACYAVGTVEVVIQ